MISTGLPVSRHPWHHGLMAKRPAAKRDFMQVARGIISRVHRCFPFHLCEYRS